MSGVFLAGLIDRISTYTHEHLFCKQYATLARAHVLLQLAPRARAAASSIPQLSRIPQARQKSSNHSTHMSPRLLSSRAAGAVSAARVRPPVHALRRFYSRPNIILSPTAGGLLRHNSLMQSRRYHNSGAMSVSVRQMSFARSLPKLVLKFVRIPAAFGGVAIAGLAYVQYKAERMDYTSDFLPMTSLTYVCI